MSREHLFSVTLNDCKVETFTVGGRGGSGKDTSNTGVRITHPPSGAVGLGTETRNQHQNKKTAWRRMGESEKFRKWVRLRAAELGTGKSIDTLVDEDMTPEKLHVEVRTAQGWVEWKEKDF